MRTIPLATSVLVACALSGLVNAAEWSQVASKGKTTIFLDARSIELKDGYVRAWILWDISTAVYSKKPDGNFDKIYSMKSLKMFSCAERKSAPLHVISYSQLHGAGQVLGEATYPQDAKEAIWTRAIPNTLFDLELQAVCARAKPS